MKRSSQLMLIFFSCVFLISSCKKDTTPAATDNSNITSIVTDGTWIITSFTQRTENKTPDYSGINFTFKSDGTVIASGTNNATGTWLSTPPSTGYYSSSTSLATFSISLGSGSAFNKLSKSWNVTEQSNTTIKLDNREVAENEHVTFSKK